VRQPNRDLGLCNIARTGLWAWTKTAAQDVAAAGIIVNLIAPGEHATDRQIGFGGSKRSGDPEDFGKVVALQCLAAKFVNGIAMGVDGGSVVGLL